MRIVFKTSYDQDLGLFKHRYQARWYALLLALLLALPWLIDEYLLGETINVLIWAIAGMGLMLLVGQSGQASLGHAAFLAIGCYATVILETRCALPFLIALPLGGAMAGGVGALLAIPLSRLHGIYMAIATLAVAVVIEDVIVLAEPLTGGVAGLFAPDISVFGQTINRYADPVAFYFLTLLVALGVTLGYRNLLRSPMGRAFAAVRDSPISAQAMGINVALTKVLAFGLSCAITGLAGGLMGHFAGVFTHETFNVMTSITLLLIVVVGGLGTIQGAYFGALVVAFLPQALALFRDALAEFTGLGVIVIPGLENAVFGVILIVFIVFEPRGIYGRWLKIRTYVELFPFYRQNLFKRQKRYLKTDRIR